ncbi:MAG: hypothetical protein EPN88_03595 [Bacteroidetes bacterium]|nr:MAG: hypothetical protein EPN88_03595 [Bacteroidota bacterium]
MTFFFDGVPSRDIVKTDSSNKSKNDTAYSEISGPVAIIENPEFTVHSPYREKECFSCHDENSKSELLMPQPDLCYICHDDFANKYKYVHGPVSGGYCTQCHNAHMSKEKKLLIRVGQKLCLYCHDSGSVFKTETHKDIADSDCTLCHNPHGGEDRFILN